MGSNYRRKIPKHVQIYQWLRAMIAKGEIKRGDKLPTEIELSHMFAVNRMTVRKAMDSLVFDAMVIRRPGKGTFLTSEKPKDLIYTLKNITSFGNDMQSVGIQPTYQAVEVKVIQADGEVSKMLKLKNDKRAIYSLRVLHANDKPVLIEKSYLPYFKFKDILDMDFNTTLYQIITEKFGIALDHATQCLTAEFPGEEETRIFGLPEPCPCMKMETVVYDPHNSPVEALFAYYRGDKYKFKFKAGHYIRHSNQ
ncbi:MAG: GntR family transcriptional regulator [Desulfobacterales bacterium]